MNESIIPMEAAALALPAGPLELVRMKLRHELTLRLPVLDVTLISARLIAIPAIAFTHALPICGSEEVRIVGGHLP